MRAASLLCLLAAAASAQAPHPARRGAKTAFCDVVITAPVPDRTKTVFLRSSDSLTLTVSGTARTCPSTIVTLFKSENGAGEVSLGTATSDVAGAWSKSITITDQVSTLVSARMTLSSNTTQSQLTFNADTRLPKMVVTAPAANDHGVLYIVANDADAGCDGGGNWHVAAADPGWLADTSCSAGGQVATNVTVTGANGGTFVVTYDGGVIFDAGVSASPQSFTPTLTLPDFSRANLTFSAANATGATSTTFLTRVGVTSPPNLVAPDGGAPALRVLEPRSASIAFDYLLPAVPSAVASADVEVAWSLPFINCKGASGTSYGGATQGVFQIPNPDGGAAITGPATMSWDIYLAPGATKCIVRIQDCVLYDPSANPQVWQCPDGSKLNGGAVRTIVFTKLPPLNTYVVWAFVRY